jgi:ferritin heavy chain
MSLCRQNFATALEDALNEQISVELNASYIYMSMASYFSRDLIALPGFAKYFTKQSNEEREHALSLSRLVNQRGGKIIYRDLPAPENDWKSAKNALEMTLQLERDVNSSLLRLHKLASDHNDPQVCDYLETHFLNEQVEAIKAVADMLTNLNRVGGEGLGLYLFDKDMGDKHV